LKITGEILESINRLQDRIPQMKPGNILEHLRKFRDIFKQFVDELDGIIINKNQLN
jgi:hypothetical protein